MDDRTKELQNRAVRYLLYHAGDRMPPDLQTQLTKVRDEGGDALTALQAVNALAQGGSFHPTQCEYCILQTALSGTLSHLCWLCELFGSGGPWSELVEQVLTRDPPGKVPPGSSVHIADIQAGHTVSVRDP